MQNLMLAERLCRSLSKPESGMVLNVGGKPGSGTRVSHRRAHHLDLAGQYGKPADAGSTPPAQQPVKFTIYSGNVCQKYRFWPAVKAVWPVQIWTCPQPAGGGKIRWEPLSGTAFELESPPFPPPQSFRVKFLRLRFYGMTSVLRCINCDAAQIAGAESVASVDVETFSSK
jgi:hypothetical protein